MNRSDFRKLALRRLKEAQALAESGNHSGAYYLSGYIVECGLKACIARKTQRFEFPDRKAVNASYTHNLEDLVKIAGLEQDRREEGLKDSQFEAYWTTVKDWTENSRYREFTEVQARKICDAIADKKHGVLRWIKRHW